MHRGVRVQREAVLHGEPQRSVVKGQHLGQTQALLHGALLQYLVLVFGRGGRKLCPILLRLPQHSGQNTCDLFVTGRGHRLLTELELVGVPKTSGKRGLQVLVPIARGYTHDQVHDFAQSVTEMLAARFPEQAEHLRTRRRAERPAQDDGGAVFDSSRRGGFRFHAPALG